jgi:hypothetical protein
LVSPLKRGIKGDLRGVNRLIEKYWGMSAEAVLLEIASSKVRAIPTGMLHNKDFIKYIMFSKPIS